MATAFELPAFQLQDSEFCLVGRQRLYFLVANDTIF